MSNNQVNPTPTPGPDPVFNPQLQKDLDAWLAQVQEMQDEIDALHKLIAASYAMKNPLLAAQMMMMAVMGVQETQISGLAAADNIDTDLRNLVSDAQTNYNGIVSGKGTIDNATQFKSDFDQLNAFLTYEQQQINSGQPSPLDSTDIKNMQDAITGITSQFGNDWNDPNQINADIAAWVANTTNGQSSPQLTAIQNDMQTDNQSTSALSTTTNTQLQYQTEQYKQTEGVLEDTNQAYLKLVQGFVQNQKSN